MLATSSAAWYYGGGATGHSSQCLDSCNVSTTVRRYVMHFSQVIIYLSWGKKLTLREDCANTDVRGVNFHDELIADVRMD